MNDSGPLGLGIGVRFRPLDEELIMHYLKHKVLGIPLIKEEQKLVAEVNLYGEKSTPWELLTEDEYPWFPVIDSECMVVQSQKVLYFFTPLPGKKKDGSFNRVAGCGTWVADDSPQPVIDRFGSRKEVGERQSFTFESPEQQTVGHWTMIEYTIDAAANGISSNHSDYVVCRILKDDSYEPPGGSSQEEIGSNFSEEEEEDDDDEEEDEDDDDQ